MNEQQDTAYSRMTPSMMLGLAAPHTWPASVLPCLLAACTSYAAEYAPDGVMVILVLVTSVLMQSSVNTFNDYFDFVKGTDTAEDNVSPDDSVLVFNNINPKHVLILAICFLVAAFLIGIRIIAAVGFVPLVFAIIGAVIVVLYSGGKTPISYLPIGELVSGVVMGGLIYLAASYCFTCRFEPSGIILCLPLVIGIGLVMMTNNTCDIEKDRLVDRRTLPVILGREKARFLYHVLLGLMIAIIVIVSLVAFRSGAITLVISAFLCFPFCRALLENPLEPSTRIPAMSQILMVNVVLICAYSIAILASIA